MNLGDDNVEGPLRMMSRGPMLHFEWSQSPLFISRIKLRAHFPSSGWTNWQRESEHRPAPHAPTVAFIIGRQEGGCQSQTDWQSLISAVD